MDLELILKWTIGGIALGVTIPLAVKIAPNIKKIFSKAKNGDAITQSITVKTEPGSSSQLAVGGRNAFAAGGDQYNYCSIASMPSATDKESAATAIKQAIRLFFSGVLGNLTKEGKREGGLLDPRNLRSGRLKADLWLTLNQFRNLRKALQKSRKTHASQLDELDQAALRDLFNDFVGKDEKAMNNVGEDDIHAITEEVEKKFIEASDKVLNKYLGI